MTEFTNEKSELKFDKNRLRVKQCPCGKSNADGKFVPYIDSEKNGFCHACGEIFLPPLQKTEDHGPFPHWNESKSTLKPIKGLSTIDVSIFKTSLNNYDKNNFITFLTNLFGSSITSQLISKYFLGSSRHWPGSTIFWQIDSIGKIRAGKIMLYNSLNGKRVKEPYSHMNWIHSVLALPNFNLQQCFFGEHLIKNNTKPIAVTESEKTAIIASVYLPQFIWIAAGSKTGLTNDKMKALTGRDVVLFPDLNAFELWSEKSKHFKNLKSIKVSTLLHTRAKQSEKEAGLDLADFLLKFSYKDFVKPRVIKILSSENIKCFMGETHCNHEFDNILIVGVRMKDGEVYDILFNANGSLVSENQKFVANKIQQFFEKGFELGIIDNDQCWVHTDNRFITQNN